MDGWTEIHEQVAAIVASSDEPIDPATVQNSLDLLMLAETCFPHPVGVGRGYWPTIRIWWDGVEFEVFPDRIDFYRFMAGQTIIHEYQRFPGDPFPERLVADLSSIVASCGNLTEPP